MSHYEHIRALHPNIFATFVAIEDLLNSDDPVASFIDLHKKKGARNRQRQHRTKTGKSEGFNDSPENQIWLNAMLNETDDLLVLHGLLGSDRKIAAERTHQNLS